MILWFEAPFSLTGEDVAEVHLHAGYAVVDAVMAELTGLASHRPAGPGEFTRRAFLNGKLDLTASEAVADLVDASTIAQARQAARQLEGRSASVFQNWRGVLLDALAALEAEIDFSAEEEVPEGLWADVRILVSRTHEDIRRALAEGRAGERLREGVIVALTGATNVGKSSLLNALARRDVAIVTAIPGTTRDILELPYDLRGLPVVLLDTAGLRETEDPVERIGVERARQRADRADIRIVMFDDPHHAHAFSARTGDIVVLNKCDLHTGALSEIPEKEILRLSCLTGEGIERLLEKLEGQARALLPADGAALVTRERHRKELETADAALQRLFDTSEVSDLGQRAEELRIATRAIGRIIGAVDVDTVLDRIFADFCIGK